MMEKINAELIRALTPVFLAAIGGIIGIVVLLVPGLGEGQRSSGIGLAGTAIAGAAGLAQSTKNESNISTGENSRVVQGQDSPVQP